MDQYRKVVITGLGVISSIGSDKNTFWSSLSSGKNGISRITSFDTSNFNKHYGGEIKNFDPQKYMSNETIEKTGRTSQLAIAATKLAIEDSQINLNSINLNKMGIVIGTTGGESVINYEINLLRIHKGEDYISKNLIDKYPYWTISKNIAFEFGCKGPNIMIPMACAAGNYAISRGTFLIKTGLADIVIAGGSESFAYSGFIGFNRLMSMAPEKVQPFDKNRKGIIGGEGSGIVILESLEHALERKAPIQAEIIGYGFSCDAYHITSPHPQGIGAAQAINDALRMADISYKNVEYINAHGTGTLINDLSETNAIKNAFKEYAYKIPISSIKSMIGHCMGAASAIEAIACCMILNNNFIPPTINYESPDPECDLDYVPNKGRQMKVDIALSNAFAFGGNNACLLFRKVT